MPIHVNVPAQKLPEDVIQSFQSKLPDYEGPTFGITTVPQNSRRIQERTSFSIRTLLNVPSNYEILYIQCSRTVLSYLICLNLIRDTGIAEYLVTGESSSEAAESAQKYGIIRKRKYSSSEFRTEFTNRSFNFDANASYVYYCDNEELNGIEFHYVPDTKHIPLVVDMSSNIFKKNIDVSKFSVILADCQQILGLRYLSMIIIKKNLIGNAISSIKPEWDFKQIIKDNKLFNEPSTYALQALGCYCEWIKKNGGIRTMAEYFGAASKTVYDIIRASNGFYNNLIDENYQSTVNIRLLLDGASALNQMSQQYKELSMYLNRCSTVQVIQHSSSECCEVLINLNVAKTDNGIKSLSILLIEFERIRLNFFKKMRKSE